MKYLFALTVVLAFLATGLLGIFIFSNPSGWDAQLYCQAAELDRAGGNPYLASEFPGGLPWLYPPALLNLFDLLCGAPIHFADSYPLIYLLAAAASLPFWQPGKDWLTALPLAASALAGLAWSLWSGNLEIFLLLPVSLTFFALRHSRWEMAAIWLGMTAAVKILPLVYLPLLLLSPLPWPRKGRLLAVGAGVFLLTLSLLTFSRPDLSPWYFRQLTGGLPGQGNPAAEFGSINHPAFPFFFAALFGWPNEFSGLIRGLLTGSLLAGGLFWLAWRFLARHCEKGERFLFLFSLAFVLLTLALPRFKPYSFLLLTPALFELVRRQNLSWRAALLITCLYPSVAFYVYYHWLGFDSTLPWAIYSQPIALLLAIALILIAEWRAPLTNSHARIARS
jgi:hypothetical protein